LLRGELPGARARFSGYFRVVDLHVIENHLLTVSLSDFVLQQLCQLVIKQLVANILLKRC